MLQLICLERTREFCIFFFLLAIFFGFFWEFLCVLREVFLLDLESTSGASSAAFFSRSNRRPLRLLSWLVRQPLELELLDGVPTEDLLEPRVLVHERVVLLVDLRGNIANPLELVQQILLLLDVVVFPYKAHLSRIP